MSDVVTKLYERSLILRCQTGDEVALAELIGRYSPALRLFLKKMGGHDSLADDLMQETWFEVYRKLNQLKQPEAFAAWVYRIARNKANRAIRRKTDRASALFEDVEIATAPEEEFTVEDAEGIRLALGELPDVHREVILLRFINDMSYDEIATVIGCTLGTVRSRLHYAKQILRQKLRRRRY